MSGNTYIFPTLQDWRILMDINTIVGQKVITSEGMTLTIMNIDGQYLQLSNGKLYSFELAYHNGFIKFKDDEMQEKVKVHFEEVAKQKEEEHRKHKELEAKFLKQQLEIRRRRLKDAPPQKSAAKAK